MTTYNTCGFLVLLAVAVAVALTVYLLLRDNLRDLLSHSLKVPGGTPFYLRSLLITLLFAGLAGAIGKEFSLKPESHFIEYIWRVGGGLEDVFKNSLWTLLGYLTLVTILIAALKPKHD